MNCRNIPPYCFTTKKIPHWRRRNEKQQDALEVEREKGEKEKE